MATVNTTVGSATVRGAEPSGPGGVGYCSIDWTSDSSGNYTASILGISGTLTRIIINPGSTAPSANYDMVLNDEDSIDLMMAAGANLSATVTTHFCPHCTDGTTPELIDTCGVLTLAITNAGSAKTGRVKIIWRR